MIAIMRAFAIAAVLIAACHGQTARGTYYYEKETVLSGTAETVTIHLPTGANRSARFVGATVYCSVACTATLRRDGTAPTGTAASTGKLNAASVASVAAAYHSSDVGAGTTIKTYTLSAGEEKLIDLADKGLVAAENLTLATSAITGTARIYFQWREF